MPTFRVTAGQASYVLAGRDPAQGGTTTIPTLLVAVQLSFDSKRIAGKPFVIDAAPDTPSILRSPIFSNFAFAGDPPTQYADALLRATIPGHPDWHTHPRQARGQARQRRGPRRRRLRSHIREIRPLLRHRGSRMAPARDLPQVPKQEGRLVLAVTHNTAYYALGDATVCCSWGTHGVDTATGNSFVLASYLDGAPAVVTDADVQPITQQLAQFVKDPLHDPLFHGGTRAPQAPGKSVPSWTRPGEQGGCGGAGVGIQYFLLEPTNTNPKNNIPASKPFVAKTGGADYHLQNVALLPWYIGAAEGLGKTYSFPDPAALPAPGEALRRPRRTRRAAPARPPSPPSRAPGAQRPPTHRLLGRLRQCPVDLLSSRRLAPMGHHPRRLRHPGSQCPEGTMQFRTPAGLDTAQFKSDIAWLKSQGKKVMISLGGGGQHFTLADPKRVPTFVSSVAQIVSDYGFDGIDVDFESPSLAIDPGDTDLPASRPRPRS